MDSEYEEIPGPHPGSLRRELFRIYRGRFCFRLGAGVRCGAKQEFAITRGETRALELSLTATVPVPGAPSATIGGRCEYTHTFEQVIGPWPLGPCDSIFPVLCFDNAELRIFRSRRPIRRYELSAFTEQFDPRGEAGWAYPNYRRNDPECDCHDRAAPTVIDPGGEPTGEVAPIITIARPATLLPTVPLDGQRDDPEAAVAELAKATGELFEGTNEESRSVTGIARSDGVIVWLDQAPTSDAPNLALLPSGLSSLPRGRATFDRDVTPLAAVGAPADASSCDIRVLAQPPGEDVLREVVRDHAAVMAERRFTAVWYEANFSELPDGTEGVIELELRDAAGEVVGYPVRERFLIDPLSAVRTPVPM